jgi:hypothetical protein
MQALSFHAPGTAPTLCLPFPACSPAFIKGIKSSIVDEQELREAWLSEAPDMELPPVLPPLYYEVSQVGGRPCIACINLGGKA